MGHKCKNKQCQGKINRPGKCLECTRIWANTIKRVKEALERERKQEFTEIL